MTTEGGDSVQVNLAAVGFDVPDAPGLQTLVRRLAPSAEVTAAPDGTELWCLHDSSGARLVGGEVEGAPFCFKPAFRPPHPAIPRWW
jgi:hypothetical protein